MQIKLLRIGGAMRAAAALFGARFYISHGQPTNDPTVSTNQYQSMDPTQFKKPDTAELKKKLTP